MYIVHDAACRALSNEISPDLMRQLDSDIRENNWSATDRHKQVWFIWTWQSRDPIMRSARAVVARAPPEILDPSDFGANTKAMGKWCIFISYSSHIFTLKIFSKILADSCVELIGLWNGIHFRFLSDNFKKYFPFRLQKEVIAAKDCGRYIICQREKTFFCIFN